MIDAILDRLEGVPIPKGRPLVIAISGFGASGKTTLSLQLVEALPDAGTVHMDSFCTGNIYTRTDEWSIFDRGRLVEQVLEPAWRGEEIRYQEFDWVNERLAGWTEVGATKVVIVEGGCVLHPPLLRWYDLTVWVDCPLDITVPRGIARDRLRGNDHDELWREIWGPNDRDYFERFRPDQIADIVVEGYRGPARI